MNNIVAARPMGTIRFILFLSAFFISVIPFWFVLINAFLIKGFIDIYKCVVICVSIFVCKIFIESEIAGGGTAFFAAAKILRFSGKILIAICVCILFMYILNPANKDFIGKITVMVAALIIPFLMKNNESGYWNGYRKPTLLSILTSLLWLYIAFIPDKIEVSLFIIGLIYAIESYWLYYGEPLKNLPNRNGG